MNLIKIPDNQLTKGNIEENINYVTQAIQDGWIDALKAHLYFKAVKKLAESVEKNTLSDAISEADKYGSDNKLYGAEFNVRGTAGTLDYEQDQEYRLLNDQLKARKKQLDDAWKAKQNGNALFDDNGEQLPVVPVKKPGGQTISVSFK